MHTPIYAHMESEARDCDGMHYRDNDYNMEDTELNGEFGDLDFYDRVLSYTVSTSAIDGTLRITQDDEGMPIFNWSESTEEGYRANRVTFHNGTAH